MVKRPRGQGKTPASKAAPDGTTTPTSKTAPDGPKVEAGALGEETAPDGPKVGAGALGEQAVSDEVLQGFFEVYM